MESTMSARSLVGGYKVNCGSLRSVAALHLGDVWTTEGGDDDFAVRLESGNLCIVLEIDSELINSDLTQFLKTLDVGCGRSKDAEAVDHRIGHEVGVGVTRSPVFVS